MWLARGIFCPVLYGAQQTVAGPMDVTSDAVDVPFAAHATFPGGEAAYSYAAPPWGSPEGSQLPLTAAVPWRTWHMSSPKNSSLPEQSAAIVHPQSVQEKPTAVAIECAVEKSEFGGQGTDAPAVMMHAAKGLST